MTDSLRLMLWLLIKANYEKIISMKGLLSVLGADRICLGCSRTNPVFFASIMRSNLAEGVSETRQEISQKIKEMLSADSLAEMYNIAQKLESMYINGEQRFGILDDFSGVQCRKYVFLRFKIARPIA